MATITLDGFDAFRNVMRAAPEVVRAHASQAVAASTFAIAQRARALVPVATGELRRSIESSHVTNSLNGRVGTNTRAAFYWRFVEFGTVTQSARPFFRPAAEAESNAFVARMRAIGPRLERDLSSSRFR